jgi:hypothetical protein
MSVNRVIYVDSLIWWIIPTNRHYGVLEADQQVTSVHIFETFNNESDWINRLSELNIHIDSNEIEQFQPESYFL